MLKIKFSIFTVRKDSYIGNAVIKFLQPGMKLATSAKYILYISRTAFTVSKLIEKDKYSCVLQ